MADRSQGTFKVNKNSGNLFSNMKLRPKLLSGFSVVIGIFVLVLALAYSHFVKIGHEVEEMETAAEELAMAANIELKFLKMSRAARAFVQKGDQKSEEATRKYQLETAAAIEKAEAEIKIEDHLILVSEIRAAFNGYISGFDVVTEKQHKFEYLVNQELEPAGDLMIKDLDELIDDARAENNDVLRDHILDAREHAFLIEVDTGRLLFEGKKEYAKKIAEEFIAFRNTLKAAAPSLHTDNERKLHKELQELQIKYETVYEKALRDQLELTEMMDVEMPKYSAIIIKDAEKLEHLASEHEHEVAEQAAHEIALAETQIVVVSVIGTVLGIGLALLLGRAIGNPIKSMTEAMKQLAAGDKTVVIPAQERGDEIGEMATTVEVFKNSMIEAERLAKEQSVAEAAKIKRAEEIATMIEGFESHAAELIEQVMHVAARIDKAASASGVETTTTGSRSFEVAGAAERTSTSIQTTAAAAEELSASVSEISVQVTKSSSIAENAVREVDLATKMVRGLDQESQKIGEVVEMISDIAEQTNLLALNATIEAARAGDAGKGFAVVASEVKNLATQTAKATEQISSMIGTIQGSTGNSVEAIEGIGNVIGEINTMATMIASAVEEQNATTQEIARTASSVSTDANIVLVSVGALTMSAARSSGKSVQMLWEAKALEDTMGTFRGEIQGFLKSVSAS